MSEQYLSQEEIDALLDAPEGEAPDAAAAGDDAAQADGADAGERAPDEGAMTDAGADQRPDGDGEPRPYDLARQERIVRGRLPTLELIHERFARSLGLAVFGLMQRNPEITHTAPQLMRYSEFLASIEMPSSINVMQTQPLPGHALLVLDGSLISTIVDLMFGGTGRPARKHEGREFSLTERGIIQKIVTLSCAEYEKAWSNIHPFQLIFGRSESQPQFANIAISTEMVVSTTFTLHFNDMQGSIRFCIPYTVLEPIRNMLASDLNTQSVGNEPAWLAQMSKEIRPANVEMVAELTTALLTLGELMNLRAGDVIEIEPGPEATLKVGQVPVFSGRYGEHNGHYAVRIDTIHSYSDSHQD